MLVDRVTGDSTLKTAALFSPHISASSDYRFIYYYILLSSVSSLSLTNKHRGFVGDSKDDSKKCCHLCGWRDIRHFIPSTRPVTNLSVVSVPGSRAVYLGSPLIPNIMALEYIAPSCCGADSLGLSAVADDTPWGGMLERKPVQFRTITGIHRPALGE